MPPSPFAAHNRTCIHKPILLSEEHVPHALMMAFFVVVSDVRVDGTPKLRLAEEDHPTQTLALDRTYESFGIRVEIGRSRRQPLERNAA